MSHTYNIPGFYANDRPTRTTADEIFDGLSAGKVKEQVQARIENEHVARAREAVGDEIGKFLVLHPEYDDTDGTPANPNPNGPLMKVVLKLRGKDPTTATAEDFRQAYQDLRDSGIPLKLNQKVLNEQRKQRIAEGAKEIEAKDHFDESDAYSMPMDQLRMRSNGIR